MGQFTSEQKEKMDKVFNVIIRGFWYHDIEAAIKAGANYLVALGLATYTEIMGGLVTGNLSKRGQSRKNYEAFLEYLGKDYVDLNKKIKLYSKLRCGLVHEYFIKGMGGVYIRFMGDGYPSIVEIIEQDNMWIIIAVQNYFEDFKKAVDKYYNMLLDGNHPDLIRSFFKAIKIFERYLPYL